MIVPKNNKNYLLQRMLWEIPLPLWLFLAVQFFLAIIWVVRLDYRLQALEITQSQQDKIIEPMKVVIERQTVNMERINYIQRQVDWLIQAFAPHPVPPMTTNPSFPERKP